MEEHDSAARQKIVVNIINEGMNEEMCENQGEILFMPIFSF